MGREGNGRKGRGRQGRGRGGKGRDGKGRHPQYFIAPPVPVLYRNMPALVGSYRGARPAYSLLLNSLSEQHAFTLAVMTSLLHKMPK